MPVNKPTLSSGRRAYTKQDFLDGKCTADGLPLGGDPVEPTSQTASCPEPISEQPSEPEATAEVQPETATSGDEPSVEVSDVVEEIVEENVAQDDGENPSTLTQGGEALPPKE